MMIARRPLPQPIFDDFDTLKSGHFSGASGRIESINAEITVWLLSSAITRWMTGIPSTDAATIDEGVYSPARSTDPSNGVELHRYGEVVWRRRARQKRRMFRGSM